MSIAVRLLLFCVALIACGKAPAEPIKIGLQKTTSPVFIAVEKGYFANEGLEPQLVYFEAGQPVAVAAVSGDIDVGIAGLTGGLYALAEQGALTIIAGQTREAPGFHANTVAASKRAYDEGLTSLKDLGGHSVAVTQIGSAFHYDLALLAGKYGFDLKTVRIVPLQTNPNSVAAVSGGTVDAAISLVTYLAPAIERGDAKLLGYIGDETPWQLAAVFTSTRTADARGDMVKRFLTAFRQATRDYHDAFTGAEERRKDGPDAPEILGILAKNTGRPVAEIDNGIGYVDRDARIDVDDVARQVAWYKDQKLVKGDRTGDQLIDMRYARPLNPSRSQ
jgi:NitT/TauT family transport system substrate-binding protein